MICRVDISVDVIPRFLAGESEDFILTVGDVSARALCFILDVA